MKILFGFLIWSFLERKLRKELCALWQFLFNFVRCPASGQLGIAAQRKALAADRQCLKQSLQRLQLTAYTTECVTMCAQNPCTVLFSYGFHKQSIDLLMLSIFTVYGSKTYDTEGFKAHWEDLADEQNAAASRRRVCLRYRQAMRSIVFWSFPAIPSCPERGQRVKRNPNLNSAESSLLTFFQESLKKLKS